MSLFSCPVCAAPLARQAGGYRCAAGHSFDLAKQNYVNLLPPNRGGAQEPGDSLEMVQARERFLARGYYQPLADRLAALCAELAPKTLLDAGCGEGTYLCAAAQALPACAAAGVDLSRPALRRAGRRLPRGEFAVASLFHLPVAPCTVDCLLHVFAPPAPEEFARVLRPGGHLLSVTPGPRHLWELKQALYAQPYENDGAVRPMPPLAHCRREVVAGRMRVAPQEDLAALYQMTPYAWRSSKAAAEALLRRDALEITFQFHVDLYRK